MLTIRKFADLAGTTRRTLLFYDEQNLFKPIQVAANGYRCYSYDQLYQLKFILQLRRLGLSIADIKQLAAADQPDALNAQLQPVLAKIQGEIAALTQLKTTLLTRYQSVMPATVPTELATPAILTRPAAKFWCSPQSVGCTDEAISELYRQFYELVGPLKLVDQHESGFLTALVGSDPDAYLTANFRIIKAVTTAPAAQIPVITRPAGRYIVATAANSRASVQRALASIQQMVTKQQLSIADQYWQFNLSEQLTSKAGSAKIAIEYQIIMAWNSVGTRSAQG